jgi:hypothetical protein
MHEDNNIEPLKPQPPVTVAQRNFYIGLGAALAAMLASGIWYLYDIGAFSSRQSYDKTWAYCESGEKCIAIRAPCDSWVAIGETHLDDARAYYDHVIALVEDSPQMECASTPQGDIQPKAYCLSGLCIVAQ